MISNEFTYDDWKDFDFHDYCKPWPQLPPDEFKLLKESIQTFGLNNPITLVGDEVVNGEIVYRILDGRHRYLVCKELNIMPRFREFEGPGSPLEFAIAENLRRRQMTPSQRAMIAGELFDIETKRAKARQAAAGAANMAAHHQEQGHVLVPVTLPELIDKGDTRDKVADAMGISGKTMSDAVKVLKSEDEQLKQAVTSGSLPVHRAADQVREREKIERAKPKQAEYYTIETWNGLSTSEKATAFSTLSDAQFNRQDNTSIEWAQWSWNPITGCKHECPYCYARDIANRFFPQGFEPSILPTRFAAPRNTKVPAKAAEDAAYKNVFTCSMADLFGRWVPAEWINYVLGAIRENPEWNFLLLTKFANRMAEFEYPKNAWLGTSVDLQARVGAAEKAMEKFEAHVKWLSIEPLIEPITFTKPGLFNWVVIGGASRSNETPEWQPPFEWVARLYMTFKDAGSAVYIKDNIGFTGPRRPREFPWVDIKAESAADVFHYLKNRKAG